MFFSIFMHVRLFSYFYSFNRSKNIHTLRKKFIQATKATRINSQTCANLVAQENHCKTYSVDNSTILFLQNLHYHSTS